MRKIFIISVSVFLALAAQAGAFSKPTRPEGAPPQPPSGAEVAARQAASRAEISPDIPPPALRIHPAGEIPPEDLLWRNRVLAVFADSPKDPEFALQLRLIATQPEDLAARDVVVITDTAPGDLSPWRRDLRPEGFSLLVLDKTGRVILRKPRPWDLREITRAIDKLPARRDGLYNRTGR